METKKNTFTKTQIKTIRKIEDFIGGANKRYDFWFVNNGRSWEGGFEIGGFDKQFRNQYSIICTPQDGQTKYVIVKNWAAEKRETKGGLKKVTSLLSDSQIEILKKYAADNEEPEDNWPAAAQCLLNGAINTADVVLP
jgi:hypothetical protein